MNTGIKTCTKCGAKNFLEFKTCFNCGGTEFVVNKNVVPPTTEEVNKRAPVGLQHVSLQQRAERPAPQAAPERPLAAERRSADAPPRAERPAGARPVPGERLERVQRAAKSPDPERRTIFDPGREIKRPLTGAEKEERVKNAVRRTAAAPDPTPSKLNMQAQQERLKLKTPHAPEQHAAPPDAVLDKIAEKLEHLEQRLDAAPAEDAAFSETQALRRAVSEDMAKLDEAIAELKSGNREVLDMVVNAQREQIERLERERAEAERKLREAGEERSKSLGALGYLDEEKRNLETQLAAERERFDLLLKDREAFKQLAVMNQPELPSEYVVFTGEQTDPDYLDYARRQFLKIYPKIEADGDKEDVIYYIPGEFKNPPVLVLNPNVSRPNKRDIKINFIDPTLGVEESGSRALIEEAAAPAEEQSPPPRDEVFAAAEQAAPEEVPAARPAVPPVIPVETRALESESVGEAAARESVSELLARMRAEEEREREKAEAERAEAPAPATPKPDEEPKKAYTFEEVLRSEDVLSPHIPDIAEAETPKAQETPERPAPERAARVKRVKKAESKRPVAACLILGALFAISLLPLLLGYLGDAALSIKGYDIIAANAGLFKEEALAENAFGLLIVGAGYTDAPLAAMAKFMPLILLLGSVFTLAAAVLCFVKPKAMGLLRALRIAVAALALALDAFFTAGLVLVLGIPAAEVFKLLLPGLWVRLAADLLLLAAGIVFMRVPRVRQADELNIKPLDITDKRAPEPEIELSQSLMRERDEIVGK